MKRITGSLSLFFFVALLAPAAPKPTNTSIQVTPSTNVNQGATVTLTATVTDSGGSPVLYGTVTFFDGPVAVATKQLTALRPDGAPEGAATVKVVLEKPGKHILTARLEPSQVFGSSVSTAQTVTIAPPIPAPITISADLYTNYSLGGNLTLNLYLGYVNTKLIGPQGQNGTFTIDDLTAGKQVEQFPMQFQSTLTLNGDRNGYLLTPVASGQFAAAIAGDFDNDGKDDTVAPRTDAAEAAYVHTQLPLKAQSIPVTQGTASLSLASGDFNADGNLDFVYKPASNLSAIEFYAGHGDGTFEPAAAIGNFAGNVLAGDFNGDGKTDVLVIGNSTYVLPGKGDGTFGSPIPSASRNWGPQLFVCDANHDGISDLIATNGVALGKPDGTFGPLVPWAKQGSQFLSFTVGDIQGHGSSDIVAVQAEPFDITEKVYAAHVFKNAGDGTYAESSSFLVVYPGDFDKASEFKLFVGDYDGDGYGDLYLSYFRKLSFPPPAHYAETRVYFGIADGSLAWWHPVYAEYHDEYTPLSVSDSRSNVIAVSTLPSGQLFELVRHPVTASIGIVGNQQPLDVPGFGRHALRLSYSGSSSFRPFTLETSVTAAGGGIDVDTSGCDRGVTTQCGFGVTNPGVPQTRTIKVRNANPAPNYSSISFTPAIRGGSEFHIASQNCQTVAWGAECSIQVTYSPTAIGNSQATLVLNPAGNFAGPPPVVVLKGSATSRAVNLSRTSHPFTTEVGKSVSGRIYVYNNTPTLLDLKPLVTGDPSFALVYDPAFGPYNNCLSVEAFSSCAMNVVFTPAKSGTFTGRIVMNYQNASGTPAPPATVDLTGSASMPPILITPQSLNLISNTGVAVQKSVSITNNTTKTVTLTPTIFNTASFALKKTCSSIAPGQSCSVAVGYTGLQRQYIPEPGNLHLNFHDAPGGTLRIVPLSGTSYPEGLQFTYYNWPPPVAQIGTYVPYDLTLENDSPNAVSPKFSIVAATNPAGHEGDAVNFSVTPGCSSIPAFGSCHIQAVFKPTSTGSKLADIVATAGQIVRAYDLTGTGVAPSQ